MKERIFYVINLDKRRITLLSLFFVGILGSFFFLGVSLGKRQAQKEAYMAFQNQPFSEDPTANQVPSENSSAPAITPQKEEKAKEAESEQVAFQNAPSSVEIIDLNEPQESKQVSEPVQTEKKSAANQKQKKQSKKSVKSNQYTIQVAAFKSKSVAEKFKDTIFDGKASEKPYIQKKNNFYLVRVGRSDTRSGLDSVLKKLKAKYRKDALILRD